LNFSPIKNEAFFSPVSAQALQGVRWFALSRVFVFLTVTHDQQEFISSQPSANVTSAGICIKNRCKPLDGLVARKVSMPVVDQLKFVQIGHYQPQIELVPDGCAELPGSEFLDCQPIR